MTASVIESFIHWFNTRYYDIKFRFDVFSQSSLANNEVFYFKVLIDDVLTIYLVFNNIIVNCINYAKDIPCRVSLDLTNPLFFETFGQWCDSILLDAVN